MIAASGRCPVIAEALAHCPVGRWVRFDDFSRFLRASSFAFGTTRNPWLLYIADANYGSLGRKRTVTTGTSSRAVTSYVSCSNTSPP